MAFPRVTPDLTRREARRLLAALENFELTPEQRARWGTDLEAYRRMRPDRRAHT